MHIIPGDPFQDEQGLPKEVLENLNHKYGLDQPIHIQYFQYLRRLAHGDLGTSLRYPSEPVTKIIKNGLPISLRLGAQALLIALTLGIFLGTLSAIKTKRSFDTGATIFSTLGVSVPNFVIAATLQLTFALYWPIFPVARWDSFLHTVLPSIALSIGPTCAITRMMRASVLDTLTKEWVTVARMKGLSSKRLILMHIVPNAFLPVLHYIGPTTANLLVGSFVIERIFSIPGLGQWFVLGVMSRDYPIIAGLTLFYSIMLYCIHTFIEYITHLFNKRLSTGEATK